MNKTQLHTAFTTGLDEIFANHKIPKNAQEALKSLTDEYLKPKTSSRQTENPIKTDDNGIITEAYCKYYQRYFPAAECNISFKGIAGKEKYRGESLLGAQRYREITREIEALKQSAQDLILDGKIEEAQKAAADAKYLFSNRINGDLYDYDKDTKRLAKEAK